MTQSSPFFSARVRRPATSEPPAGSENSWHQTFSPEASGGRYLRFCSSPANAIMVGPHMPCPMMNMPLSLPNAPPPCSKTRAWGGPAPPPPYSFGQCRQAQPASAFFFCQAFATSRILAPLSWLRPSEAFFSSSSYCFGALAAIQALASARNAASCGVSSKFIRVILARHSGRSASRGSIRNPEGCYVESPGSRFARTGNTLRRIPLSHSVDQRVFPIRETAERQRRRVGAPVIHVAVEFPGETHAAMDLDVVLGTMLERLGRADARGGRGLRQFRRIGRERPGAVVAIRARQRRRDIHVGEHMFYRLERADRPAEGDTIERIVAAHFQRAVGAPDLLERHQHRGAVEHLRDNAPAFIGAAERLGLAIPESEFGLSPRWIDIGQRPGLDALGLHVHQEQRDVGLAPARSGARGDNREIGNGAVGHRLLHAIEAAAGGREFYCLRRRIALAFEQRQRTDRFPRCDQGQPFLFLRIVAREQERFRRKIDGGRKRHRRQRAAHLFRDHAKLEMARTGAAIGFRDRDAEKAHVGEALPELPVVGLLAVEHRAHRFRRAFFGKKFPRLVAQLFLFFGEIEIHGVLLRLMMHEQDSSFRGASETSEPGISRFRVWSFGPSRNDG